MTLTSTLRPALAVLLVALWLPACSDTPVDDFDEDERGALLGTTAIESLSKEEITDFGLPLAVDSPVDLYRMTYRTIDPQGNLTTASSLLAVPTTRSGRLALLSYQHGTIVRKAGVPSFEGTDNAETLVAVMFATSGYLAIIPDYLGLGESPGLHPFVHGASLATAVVDALRSARHYARRNGISLEERIFLGGYSEGGYATAAAQRLIESEHRDEFTIAASAPMAGPLDLSDSMVGVFREPVPYPAPFFLPYTLVAYDDVYDLTTDFSDVFAPPYHTVIPPLFDGVRGSGEIDAQLPAVPLEMLHPDFVDTFLNESEYPWRVRVGENDMLDWVPTSRTRIFHCVNDDLIPFSNAERAIEHFRAGGAPESRVDLFSGDYGTHGECAPVFLLFGKLWIDGVRSGTESAAKLELSAEEISELDWRPIDYR